MYSSSRFGAFWGVEGEGCGAVGLASSSACTRYCTAVSGVVEGIRVVPFAYFVLSKSLSFPFWGV